MNNGESAAKESAVDAQGFVQRTPASSLQSIAPGAFAALNPDTFRAFFEQSPFYAGILAPDGTLRDASRFSLENSGFSREQVLGKKFWDTGWWHGSKEVQAKVRAGFDAAVSG